MEKLAKSGIYYLVLFSLCFVGGRMTAQSQEQTALVSNTQRDAKLAIVIDDFGYNGEGTTEMLSLDIPFTVALMPFSEDSAENVILAEAAGKEIIIHMPMQSKTGDPAWVGDTGIFCNMTDGEIVSVVEEAFAIVPNAVGVNNHMGSAVMEDGRSLGVLMADLAKRDVFFLDSVTTGESLGQELAEVNEVPFLARDVFLDSTDSKEEVKANLRRAAEIAIANGEALAIGHVGPEGGMVTVEAIQELQGELEGLGIDFVFASELVGDTGIENK